MLEKFRKLLKKDGRTFVWFHKVYVGKICTYSYFIRQINVEDCLQDDVKKVIKKYIEEV